MQNSLGAITPKIIGQPLKPLASQGDCPHCGASGMAGKPGHGMGICAAK